MTEPTRINMTAGDASILGEFFPGGRAAMGATFYDVDALVVMDPEVASIINGLDLASLQKKSLQAYALSKRWRVETGGIEVGGMTVATDDRAKVMIQGARKGADEDPEFTADWDDGADGVTLNAQQIIAISNAVLAHVQAVFSTYKTVKSSIASGSISSRAQVDAAFAAI